MKHLIGRVTREEEGQDLVEYALLLATIAFFVIAGINTVAPEITLIFGQVVSTLVAAAG